MTSYIFTFSSKKIMKNFKLPPWNGSSCISYSSDLSAPPLPGKPKDYMRIPAKVDCHRRVPQRPPTVIFSSGIDYDGHRRQSFKKEKESIQSVPSATLILASGSDSTNEEESIKSVPSVTLIPDDDFDSSCSKIAAPSGIAAYFVNESNAKDDNFLTSLYLVCRIAVHAI